MKKGDKVVYNKELKALEYGTVGIIHRYHKKDGFFSRIWRKICSKKVHRESWVVIYYEQNVKKNLVCYHSAYISEISLVK